jgi:hypothetical protein
MQLAFTKVQSWALQAMEKGDTAGPSEAIVLTPAWSYSGWTTSIVYFQHLFFVLALATPCSTKYWKFT